MRRKIAKDGLDVIELLRKTRKEIAELESKPRGSLSAEDQELLTELKNNEASLVEVINITQDTLYLASEEGDMLDNISVGDGAGPAPEPAKTPTPPPIAQQPAAQANDKANERGARISTLQTKTADLAQSAKKYRDATAQAEQEPRQTDSCFGYCCSLWESIEQKCCGDQDENQPLLRQ